MYWELHSRVLGSGLSMWAVNSRKGVKLKIPVIVMDLFIEIRAYLGEIVDLVLDHCHKASHMNLTSIGYPVHIKVLFTPYCSLLSVQ